MPRMDRLPSAELHRLLRREGFEPYDGDEPEAFESEPVPPEWADNNKGLKPGYWDDRKTTRPGMKEGYW